MGVSEFFRLSKTNVMFILTIVNRVNIVINIILYSIFINEGVW